MVFVLSTDSSTYAHFVFNVFDQDRDGTVSFEVRVIGREQSDFTDNYWRICAGFFTDGNNDWT